MSGRPRSRGDVQPPSWEIPAAAVLGWLALALLLLPAGQGPQTRHVRGSNHCLIGIFADRVPGRAILLSAIDNLVKGASGQAVQDMNVMLGLPEIAGLAQEPLFP